MANISITEKKCTACLRTKPLGDFPKSAKGIGGVGTQCNVCKNAKRYARDYMPALKPCEPLCPLVERKCERCKEVKPISTFRLRKYHRSDVAYRIHTCRQCLASDNRRYVTERTPERHAHHRAMRNAWANTPHGKEVLLRCDDKRRENGKHWEHIRTKYGRTDKATLYLKLYGITLADYKAMESQQNGLCAICRQPDNKKALAVDHDHATGKVRALLCGNCNLAIGLLKDSPQLLANARNYLLKFAQHELKLA